MGDCLLEVAEEMKEQQVTLRSRSQKHRASRAERRECPQDSDWMAHIRVLLSNKTLFQSIRRLVVLE